MIQERTPPGSGRGRGVEIIIVQYTHGILYNKGLLSRKNIFARANLKRRPFPPFQPRLDFLSDVTPPPSPKAVNRFQGYKEIDWEHYTQGKGTGVGLGELYHWINTCEDHSPKT